ncbi:ribosomal RNA small subunit methyltransferase D [bacterium BMS3Abin02]|nr:ribosomal RNA small subunit methyltransferase D [bacterium BMS3Abin02]GBE23522.1 ribosomal RNA small subunit methyltransferase D [bacterium BMS3Bbin01]HDH27207.1 16S rRNA (guanine(966)-N(2))-methyltransferase RsmD [Actinomycetota bacterium]HDK46241.1 16S rRNA (guanine(966)-N(2))-methyltransferase RsmD [Actinomycetota bacterium]HDL48753.1 16S rRNA (guanine(966)-N(2))-methyltransferase RsmD [Actinomycetota bacterium]
MRIIAGMAKGRRLSGPSGSGTRPMTDRAREALFSSLGDRVVDARVFDLYAGSGSIGLEALSRGARSVVFVERARPALMVLRRNIDDVGLGGTVSTLDVERFLDDVNTDADLVFVDPPYGLSLASVEKVLCKLVPRLTTGADVILHRRVGERPPNVGSLALVDRHRYGDTVLWRLRKEEA